MNQNLLDGCFASDIGPGPEYTKGTKIGSLLHHLARLTERLLLGLRPRQVLSQPCSKAWGDPGTVISTGVKESDRKEAGRASLIKKWAASNSLGKSYEFEMPNRFGTSKESIADKRRHEIQLEE